MMLIHSRHLYILVLLTFTEIEGFLYNTGKRVCYNDLGCYSTDPPFWSSQRLFVALPDQPQSINTTFFLYTRDDNGNTRHTLLSTSPNTLKVSSFDVRWPTIFIVHGFVDSTDNIWIVQMVKELLKYGNMNVFGVDWRFGSRLPYTQAAANTRVVGAEIAKMIKFIHKETQVLPYVHIIGHSLGAHVAGYAGTRLYDIEHHKVNRITGLDPAETYFEHTDPVVRLDPTDAQYVDVIHTDAGSMLTLGLGLYQAVGHVDIYPNGGESQPGCIAGVLYKAKKGLWDMATNNYTAAEEAVACSHKRATKLFTESINSNCQMTAYPCSSWEDFEKGLCLSCIHNRCQRLGYHSNKTMGRGMFYLSTRSQSPYCSAYYLIAVKISKAQHKMLYGRLEVELIGGHNTSHMTTLNRQNIVIKPGAMFTKLVITDAILGSLSAVKVQYVEGRSWSWLYGNKKKVPTATLR